MTALTAVASTVKSSQSLVQQARHMSQGPMRSEKVYMMTQMVENKLEMMEQQKLAAYEKFDSYEMQQEEEKLALVDEEEFMQK